MRRFLVAAVVIVAIAIAAFVLTRPAVAPRAPVVVDAPILPHALSSTASTPPSSPQPSVAPTTSAPVAMATSPAPASAAGTNAGTARPRPAARGLVMRDDDAEGPRSPGAVGTMSKESIRAAVKAVLPKVQDCYEQALKVSPDLDGTINVSFTLAAGDDGKGTVTEGEVADSDTASPFFDACVLKEVAGAQFDAPGGSGTVKVTYPFSFSH